jgi:hypothetical protein
MGYGREGAEEKGCVLLCSAHLSVYKACVTAEEFEGNVK